ncbi:AraC family transcriptional regulator [Bacillus sp. AR18-7]|nr:AraC family transcriptional regulator [Bacillus sp. AR18-7]
MENMKFVDERHIITSAGISAGINMSFHIVKNFLGVEIAEETAKNMEYDIIDLQNKKKAQIGLFSYFECI